jgi:site-specific DNA recombinase
VAGSSYTLISKNLLGCMAARNKGTCGNRLNIRVETLESSVVSDLRTHLMDPALLKEFCAEFTREVNRRRIEGRASLVTAKVESARIDRELDRLMKLILASDDIEASKRVTKQMTTLEDQKEHPERTLREADTQPPLLHPNMAEIYRSRVAALYDASRSRAPKRRLLEPSTPWWTKSRWCLRMVS